MIDYDFLTASSLETALDYLNDFKDVMVIAGGTDVLVNLHNKSKRLPKIAHLLNINSINSLKYIYPQDHHVEIGPLVTHSELIGEPLIEKRFPILLQAASYIGSTQIRNRGTIGGNICNASPAADLLPPLLALNAELVLTEKREDRIVPLEKFLTAPYQTILRQQELLTKIRIPFNDKDYYMHFQKIGRRKALSISRLNLAVVAKIDEKDIFQDTRVVPGSATPYPQRLPEVEKMINGQSIHQINLEEVSRLTSEELVSITGTRWSTPYKKPVICTLIQRALKQIIKEKTENE